MRRPVEFEHRPWFLVPFHPEMHLSFRRWNLWLISALIFIVLGVFAMTMTAGLGPASASMHNVPPGTTALHSGAAAHQAHRN